jgi:hypothetical protein
LRQDVDVAVAKAAVAKAAGKVIRYLRDFAVSGGGTYRDNVAIDLQCLPLVVSGVIAAARLRVGGACEHGCGINNQ